MPTTKPIYMADASAADLFDLTSFLPGRSPGQDPGERRLEFDDTGRLKDVEGLASYDGGFRARVGISFSKQKGFQYGTVVLGPRLTRAVLASPDGELPHLSLLQDVYLQAIERTNGEILIVAMSNIILGDRWLTVFKLGSDLHRTLLDEDVLNPNQKKEDDHASEGT